MKEGKTTTTAIKELDGTYKTNVDQTTKKRPQWAKCSLTAKSHDLIREEEAPRVEGQIKPARR